MNCVLQDYRSWADRAGVTSGYVSALILVSILLPAQLGAQSETAPAFNSLRTPPSPAFTLLGIEPSSVERPSNPSALALSVLNSSNNFGALPQEYALEVSPYWLFGHPTLTWRADTSRTLWESVARTATISFATAQLGTDDRPTSGFGLGARASLVSGRISKASYAELEALETFLKKGTSKLARIQNDLKNARNDGDSIFVAQFGRLVIAAGCDTLDLGGCPDSTKDDAREFAETLADAIRVGCDPGVFPDQCDLERVLAMANIREAEILELAKKDPEYLQERERLSTTFENVATVREGFFLEVAGGVALDVPRLALDSADFRTWGIWLTPSYQKPNLSIVGVLRYLGPDEDSGFESIDVGLRFMHTRSDFSASLEYVHRQLLGDDAPDVQYRLAGVLDYQLRDDLWLNATLGKSFDEGADESLLAQIGISFDFNRERFKKPEPE